MVFFAEAYFTALRRETIYDVDGRSLGRVVDLLVRPRESYPIISRVVLKPRDSAERVLIPYEMIRSASAEGLRLSCPLSQIPQHPVADDEISVLRRILDRQIVDVRGRRVVRVNDVKFGAIGRDVLLTHVDVGTRGLLRRLHWEHFTLGLCRLLHLHFPERLIGWEHVQLPREGGDLHVDASREALARLPAADLADLAEALNAPERAAFLGNFDEDVAADALQEMEPDVQVSVVNELTDEQASDIIEEMDPDEGADLLAELSEDRAESILKLMEPEEAADLRELMQYHPETAGGLMTTDLVTVPETLTVAETLELLRTEAAEAEPLYYVYVVDSEEHLNGVFSLRDLIVAQPEQRLTDIMTRDVVRVHVHTLQRDIAHTVAHYNLLAVPVVDDDNHLLGMVTVDDAIDAVIPTAWKKRIPRAFGR